MLIGLALLYWSFVLLYFLYIRNIIDKCILFAYSRKILEQAGAELDLGRKTDKTKNSLGEKCLQLPLFTEIW